MGYGIQGSLNSSSQLIGGAIKLGRGKDEECKKLVFNIYRYMTGMWGRSSTISIAEKDRPRLLRGHRHGAESSSYDAVIECQQSPGGL